ncbi:uncharacterized protein LOC134180817 [Corticium candelabrum]|uniref:uncharacterized protein LOC134180817 n=1 Tax=Corticium candelabrum TaxID=121492 RepID=UPI002E254287|nr:uncharacterized protein LOC134180817 [Corticium candelabrum]
MQLLDLHDSLVVLFRMIEDQRLWNSTASDFFSRIVNEYNLQGINGRIQFRTTSERVYPMLYNILDISPFLVATIGVYDVSTGWVRKLSSLSAKGIKRSHLYRRSAQTCYPAEGHFRTTTMIVISINVIKRCMSIS